MLDVEESTGGTASPYISGAYSYVHAANVSALWLDTAMQSFNNLAEHKLQRAEIPKSLDKLSQGLSGKFSLVLQSVDKAKIKFELQSGSVMAMRDFLSINFWGNLLEFARRTKPLMWQGFQKSKLKQSDTRDLVAKSLSNNLSDERKLVQLFQDMADLCNEMSNTQVGKNVGLDDLPLLNTLFTRWFLLIDEIVRILQL